MIANAIGRALVPVLLGIGTLNAHPRGWLPQNIDSQ